MTQTTEIQPAKNGKDVRTYLEANLERIAEVCERHITPEKVIQLAAICAYRNPEIARCDPASVLAAVIQAASLGLDLHPSSGEAYLIPRWNGQAKCLECQFQAGYQGLCKLARQAGTRYIHARVVRANDVFLWRWSPELEMSHEPSREANPGPTVGAYCVARTETGELLGEYMSLVDIERIRARSQSPNKGPWATDFEEMAKKTPCRRLCKWLPKSPKLVEALASIDADVRQEPPPEDDPTVPPDADKTSRITAVVAARAATVNGNGNGSSPPPAPPQRTPEAQAVIAQTTAQRTAVIAQVAAEKAAEAQAALKPAIAVSSAFPAAPKSGRDLEQWAQANGALDWFVHLGATRGYRHKVGVWTNGQVSAAWDEYQNEGIE